MKRITWEAGKLLSIELREGLHALGQMAPHLFLTLLDCSSEDGGWRSVDGAKLRKLFQVTVLSKPLFSNLPCRLVEIDGIGDRFSSVDRHWLKPYMVPGNRYPFRGARLIELPPDERPDTAKAPVIKPHLQLPADREVIERTELTNMWGDQDLGDRLRRYFDTGVNRDDLKFEIFPGLWDDREKLRPLTRRLPVPLR